MQIQSIVRKKWLLPLGLATMVSLPVPVLAYDEIDLEIVREIAQCYGCDLEGAPLRDLNLYKYRIPGDLRRANLRNADLFDSILYQGNLERADFSGANLAKTLAHQANFTDANLTGANVSDAGLESANLTRANLTNANFTESRLQSATLVNANLTGAIFNNADLRNANMNGAIGRPPGLATANALTRTVALNADEPTFTDFTGASLDNVIALNTQLPNAIFAGATLVGSNFSGSDLIGVDFSDADLVGATFLDVNLRGANITSEQLNSLGAFSGTLPDGTVVGAATTTPEPGVVFALMGVGLLGSKLRSSKRKEDKLN